MSKIENKVPEALNRLVEKVDDWTKDGVKIIRREVEREMRLAKTGKTYGSRVASAPGEAPAINTKQLLDSLVYDPRKLKNSLGSTLIQAAALEKGADIKKKNGTKYHLDARPFLVRAARQSLPTLEQTLDEACRKAQIV